MHATHGGVAWRGVAELLPKGHLQIVSRTNRGDKTPNVWKERPHMTALTRSLGQFRAALGVVGTAISVAASLRITHPSQSPALNARD